MFRVETTSPRYAFPALIAGMTLAEMSYRMFRVETTSPRHAFPALIAEMTLAKTVMEKRAAPSGG